MMKKMITSCCCSEAIDGPNLDERNESFGRQKLRRGMSYERFATGCGDHVVESKQANQEEDSNSKFIAHSATKLHTVKKGIEVSPKEETIVS